MNDNKQEDWEKKEPSLAQRKYWDSLKGLKNEKAPNWKDGPIRKESIHQWMNANFGKPKVCENPNCEGKSQSYDWAKKTEADYVKDRNAFYRLCRSCHRVYDLTPEKREQAIKNLWWKKGEKAPGVLIKKGDILNPKGTNRYTRKQFKESND